ncbi:cyanophycin synthetase [Candidatus Uhrbacteria bacterium]|nr:cyanophycin synthetase [Candidatus Uhrbacteria bacterium]
MKPCFVSPILAKMCVEMGITIHIEPRYGYAGQIVLSDGRKRYFRSTNFDLNPLGASEVAWDKSYAAYFMRLLGYPIIEGRQFLLDWWGERICVDEDVGAALPYARELGYPVIVKPNSKSQGSGVHKVHSDGEMMLAIQSYHEKERVFLVQRFIPWRDYRIVVLDDEVISAYERMPLSVIGDGISSVQRLLDIKQERFIAQGRDTRIKNNDPRIDQRLRRDGRNLTSFVPAGETWQLLDHANLSSGGDARDVTDSIHPMYTELAVKLTRDMGLRYCGVDLFVNGDLASPTDEYVICEINAAPGIDNYASIGADQQKRVEAMYRKIVEALIR